MKKISLAHMKPGTKGVIVDVRGELLKSRLMSMGLFLGQEITKVSHFALRGPVMVKAARSTIALGHSMAQKIFVEANE